MYFELPNHTHFFHFVGSNRYRYAPVEITPQNFHRNRRDDSMLIVDSPVLTSAVCEEFERAYGKINIMVPDYAEHLKSDTFNSLTVEQQNEELKRTVIALSNDFEKIVRIMLGIQDNLRDVTEWMDQDILATNNKIDYIDEKMRNHVDSVHARLIIGKEKEK